MSNTPIVPTARTADEARANPQDGDVWADLEEHPKEDGSPYYAYVVGDEATAMYFGDGGAASYLDINEWETYIGNVNLDPAEIFVSDKVAFALAFRSE